MSNTAHAILPISEAPWLQVVECSGKSLINQITSKWSYAQSKSASAWCSTMYVPICVSPLLVERALLVVVLLWLEEEASEHNGWPWSEAHFGVEILKNRDLRNSTSKI